MSNFLVTGGVGCIGSHLVQLLVKKGHKVTIIDKLVYPEQSHVVLDEIKKLCSDVGFYNLDLTDYDKVLEFFINNSFDGVFHLAALPSHRVSLSFPIEYLQNDLVATVNILEVVRKICPKIPIVFSSTNKVYSDEETLVSEQSKIEVKGPYAMSKYQSENWCQFYNSRFGLRISVVRLFHVVGARMQPHRETPKFIKAILANEPVSIHGKFIQSNFLSSSFGYTNVWDCVEGIDLIMANTSDNFEIYNIGSKTHLAVLDIYKIINQELGLQTEVIYTPLMEHETLGCVADTAKIAKLGWVEKHQARQAVIDYVSWYKANFVTTSENSKKTKRLSGVLVGNF